MLLLGNVLDATYLDVAKISFKSGPVYLAQSAQLILEILEPIVAREKRVVELDIPADLRIWVDELRMRQVLLNLLGNALKYTPSGTPIALRAESLSLAHFWQRYPEVRFQKETAADVFVVLTVRDWGPGISPAEQAQLFTRFTRLESARRSSQPGAGLGLYLCKQLIEAMSGSIWMESSGLSGEGVTFFVVFPRYIV